MKSLEQLKLESIKRILELRLKSYTEMKETNKNTIEYGTGLIDGHLVEIKRLLEFFEGDEN